MDPLASEENTLADYIAQTSQGLETVLRIPQHVSAGVLALAIAAAVVGAWLAVRKILELIRGWQSERHVREAMGEHRAEAARREAYEHARMLSPEPRGLRREGPAAEGAGDGTRAAPMTPRKVDAPIPETFSPQTGHDPDRLLLAVVTTLIILAGLATLIFILRQ